MIRKPFILAAVVAFLAVAGCEMQTMTVTRFNKFEHLQAGKTFAMYAMDAKKADTLEFKHYTALVRARVRTATGWTPVGPDDPHDYKVAFDYTAGKSRTVVYPEYGSGWTLGGGYWHGGPFFSSGYGFGAPYDWETYYDYQLRLDIRESGGPGRPDSKVFEAKAGATEEASDIAHVMPCLLTALFRNFPGFDGQNYSITIPYAECTPQNPRPVGP